MAFKNSIAMVMLTGLTAVTLNAAVMAQSGQRTVKVFRTTVSSDRVPARNIHDHRGPDRNTHDHRTPARNVHDHRGPNKRPTQVPPSRNTDDRRSSYISFEVASRLMGNYREFMIGANNPGHVYPKDSYSGPLTSDTGHLYPNKTYNIKGLANRKFLQYKRQGKGRGINVGWTNNASADTAIKEAKWFLTRQARSAIGIRYGERLAIAWRDNSQNQFVNYSRQSAGIDLELSSRPSYEWVILGGKPGTFVRRGVDRVILYNVKTKRPLIYADRLVGGDIGWPHDNSWIQQVIAKAGKIGAKKYARIEDVVKSMMTAGGNRR